MSSESRPATTGRPSPDAARIERTTARYLFAISTLSTESDGRITTGDLREYLDVAPASVTEMVSKLDDQGFVDYEKYQGVTLTEQGNNAASNVGWRFCVVTSFFESALNATLEEQTAFEIGYTLPREAIARLHARLDVPCLDLCPESGHGGDCCPA